MIITVHNAEQTLSFMLTSANLDLDSLPLDSTWDIFTTFCKIPVEGASDGVLVEWGPDSRSSPDSLWDYEVHVGFYFSVLRQFYDLSGEEYEQLIIIWHFPRDPLLDSISDEYRHSDWCFAEDGSDITAFLNEQQNTELFQSLLQRQALWTEIRQYNTG